MAKHKSAMEDRGHTTRGCRYIFIVDRRHPENRRQCDLVHDAVVETRKTWSDKIYLIGPKQCRAHDGRPLCVCGCKLVKVAQSGLQCAWCGKSDVASRWECPKNDSEEHAQRYALCIGCEKEREQICTYCRLPAQVKRHPEAAMALSRRHILFVPR